MGLAAGILFLTMCAAAFLAALFAKEARRLGRAPSPARKTAAAILFLLALFCAVAALFMAYFFWECIHFRF